MNGICFLDSGYHPYFSFIFSDPWKDAILPPKCRLTFLQLFSFCEKIRWKSSFSLYGTGMPWSGFKSWWPPQPIRIVLISQLIHSVMKFLCHSPQQYLKFSVSYTILKLCIILPLLTQELITVFTWVNHWTLFWARRIPFISSKPNTVFRLPSSLRRNWLLCLKSHTTSLRHWGFSVI
jgi:hypothetical protein